MSRLLQEHIMVATQTRRAAQAEQPQPPLAPEPEAAAAENRRSRKPQETSAEKAIREIKNLVLLKLKVQQGRDQAAALRSALEKLFSNEDISEAEANQLLDQIDALAEYIKLRRQYREAREKARPALALLAESEVSEDEILEFE